MHTTRSRIRRILLLGNSITRHPPKADIGWTNNFGMAASSQEKDYVHLLLQRFADAAGGKAPEARIENGADFEREYATYPIATKFKELAEFKADTVILCIAENVPKLATQAERKFANGGVGIHPGDTGMAAIAEAIWGAVTGKAATK